MRTEPVFACVQITSNIRHLLRRSLHLVQPERCVLLPICRPQTDFLVVELSVHRLINCSDFTPLALVIALAFPT